MSRSVRLSPLYLPERLPLALAEPTKTEMSERCGWQEEERSGLNKGKQKAPFYLQQKSSGMLQVLSDLTGEYNNHYEVCSKEGA